MTPRPLLFLAVLAAASPAAAGDPKAVVVHEAYNVPREEPRHDAARSIQLAQTYLTYPDGASVGGPNHVEQFIAEDCLVAPGECTVLTEQLRDMMVDGGAQTSPHVYAVAFRVVAAFQTKLDTIAGLDKAFWESSFSPAGVHNPRTKRTGREASSSTVQILKMMLGSDKSIKTPSWTGPLAQAGAVLAAGFKDSGAYLEQDLKALLASKDREVVRAAVAALGERVRNLDTDACLATLYRGSKDGMDKPDLETRALILENMAKVQRTLWPMRIDKQNHNLWTPADTAAGAPYFTFACWALEDAECFDKDGKPVPAKSALCAAAQGLYLQSPRPHQANCREPKGRPLDPKCG